MGLISVLWGIVAMVWMIVALIPLIGITNWLLIPFAAVGAIIAGMDRCRSRAERVSSPWADICWARMPRSAVCEGL